MDANKVSQLSVIKAKIKDLNDELKQLAADKDQLEHAILHDLEEDGLTGARTPYGTVGILETTVPNVQDWAEFEEYIYNNRALYLLQRRASSTAFREELKTRDSIPGVTPFVKKTLSLTNAPK